MSEMTIGQAAATGYFVDQKKGEVNELKQVLSKYVEKSTFSVHNQPTNTYRINFTYSY